MKNTKYLLHALIFALILPFVGCDDNNSGKEFKGNNKEVLKNWAENIIIPAYKNYQSQINTLVDDAKKFDQEKTDETLQNLQKSWLEAYKAFQKVVIFDFGIAHNSYFNGITNTYPTNPEAIQENIALIADGKSDEIKLRPTFLVKQQVYQGFPALDYLLFQEGHTLAYYQTETGHNASTYIVMLAEALQNTINTIVTYWDENKNTYIEDADNSVTGAYSSTINAFIRVYEKDIRAAKVGYAAGAIKAQNGKPAPEIIEAYYNGNIDKELLEIALRSSQDFFNGKHFDGDKTGKSLKSILEDLDEKDLVAQVNNQYDEIYNTIKGMPNSLKETAVSDTEQMKALYDVIQVNVALYKTKMVAALSVQLGYQDTDGD